MKMIQVASMNIPPIEIILLMKVIQVQVAAVVVIMTLFVGAPAAVESTVPTDLTRK